MTNTNGVLTDLIAQRDRLTRAIDALQALSGPVIAAPKLVPATQPITKRRRRARTRRPSGTFPKAVLQFLSTTPGTHSKAQITDMLPAFGVNGNRSTRQMGVHYALRRLVEKGHIAQTENGYEIATSGVQRLG